MTNHPNRTPVYRVSLQNGRFDHVRGKGAAVARAAEMIEADGAGPLPHRGELVLRQYGVRIERVSADTARAVGL